MILALRLARRELRGGVRGLWVVLLCLALGVAVIAAVGTLRAGTERGLSEDGRRILGGDLEVQTGAQSPPPALLAWLHAHGAQTSEVTQMRSLLVAPSGQRTLVMLRAADAAWPLIGLPAIEPPQPLQDALREHDGRFGLLADPVVLARLGLHAGQTARLGEETFSLRGALVSEPDRVASPAILGAPVLIAKAALPATGLVVPGSLVSYAVRAILPDPAQAQAVGRALQAAFPKEGWRVRRPVDAVSSVSRFIDETSQFMTLVGLTSLLVGGIGVANGVRAWLDARARDIATLRCLGASSGLVFAVCLIQVMALAGLGILAGLATGAALPAALEGWLGGLLPVPPEGGIYPAPLALAAGYGVLTALVFSLWPLGRAARIPGAALFRDALIPEHVRPPAAIIAANLVLVVALAGLAIAAANDRFLAAWFCASAVAALLIFRLGAAALMRAASLAGRALPLPVRLGLASLHRPGAATPLMLVSIGLGLSALAAVVLIEGNMRRAVMQEMPADAPNFYFVDVQSDQLARFEGLVHATPGFQAMQQMPSLRARIVSVNGVPAEQVAARAAPDSRWGLRGDRGLTYAARPPPGTRLVAGQWWTPDYSGPPLVSLDADLAKGWGIGVGATITVNVLGRDIDLRVSNLREIAWRRLGLNFIMVASPGLLAGAPHTHIATVRVAAPDRGLLLRRVTDTLPNVTGIDVDAVLADVGTILGQIATALALTGSVTLAAGILVLMAAVAAGRRRRTHEAVILKTLGATRTQLRLAWLAEFGALGLASGLLAGLIGAVASWAVLHYIMLADWVFLPGRLSATLAGALAMMLLFGYVGTSAALRAKAAPQLRNE